MFLLLLRPLKIFIYSFPRKVLSSDSAASHLHSNSSLLVSATTITTTTIQNVYLQVFGFSYSIVVIEYDYNYAIVWNAAYQFLLIFPLTAPNGNGSGPAKNSL